MADYLPTVMGERSLLGQVMHTRFSDVVYRVTNDHSESRDDGSFDEMLKGVGMIEPPDGNDHVVIMRVLVLEPEEKVSDG